MSPYYVDYMIDIQPFRLREIDTVNSIQLAHSSPRTTPCIQTSLVVFQKALKTPLEVLAADRHGRICGRQPALR